MEEGMWRLHKALNVTNSEGRVAHKISQKVYTADIIANFQILCKSLFNYLSFHAQTAALLATLLPIRILQDRLVICFANILWYIRDNGLVEWDVFNMKTFSGWGIMICYVSVATQKLACLSRIANSIATFAGSTGTKVNLMHLKMHFTLHCSSDSKKTLYPPEQHIVHC